MFPRLIALSILFAFFLSTTTTAARKIPFKRRSSNSKSPQPHKSNYRIAAVVNDDNSLDLTTAHDLIYIANITLGGHDYPVQLDTGSSDLWIRGPSGTIPNAERTDLSYNLTYGIGWAYGHVSYTSFEFAGISVPSQAFLDISQVDNPALGYGADGILGLGFSSLSTVDALVNNSGSDAGRAPLHRLFEENPGHPNFITFALQRSTQESDDVEGSFTIGEYEPKYAEVANQVAISTFPVKSPKRWNVLLEAVFIGNTIITPETTVAGAPSNRAVVLLDSGTSYTYAPETVCNAIYGGVNGARYEPSIRQWIVPCEAEIDMAFQFNGKIYPLHPLDIAPKSLSDPTTCVGTFIPQAVAVGAGQFDWLIGDNFLRSVYSLYDFGDLDANNVMGNPYVKLLSLTDPNEASAEFVAFRGGTARTNITYQPSNTNAAGAGDGTTVSLGADVERTLDMIGTYLPAVLGVMALNALVLVALLVLGAVFLCRRRRLRARAARARTPGGRASPITMDPRSSYVAGSDSQDAEGGLHHSYEPVSMAITENTVFVPPSPGFRKLDSVGDRPKSLASLPSHSNFSKSYQQLTSEDLDSPPSPGFYKDSRPMSVGILPSQTTLYNPPAEPEDQPFLAPKIPFYDAKQKGADAQSVHSQTRSVHSETQKTGDIADESAFAIAPLPPPSPTQSMHSQTTRVEGSSMDVPRNLTPPNSSSTHSRTPSPDTPPQHGSTPPPASYSPSPRPILRTQLSDRPQSAMFPSALARASDETIPLRPSSGLRPLRLSETHRPMSAMLPNQAGAMVPPLRSAFAPAPSGLSSSPPALRPILRSQTSDDRPRSVAFTPERTQTYPPPHPSRGIPPPPTPASAAEAVSLLTDHPSHSGDPAMTPLPPPNPAFLQRSSPLRQASGRPMSMAVLGAVGPDGDADNSDFRPPNPAFRAHAGGPSRQPSGSSLRPNQNGFGGDRPMSVA